MPKKRDKPGVARILMKFSLSYFVLLLIPLAMSIGCYLFTQHIVRNNIDQQNALILANSIDRIENSLSEAESFAHTLYRQEGLSALLRQNKRSDAQTLYSVYRMTKLMPALGEISGLIDEYFVVDGSARFLLTSGHAYINLERSYPENLKVDGMDYAEWKERVLGMDRLTGSLPAQTHMGLDGRQKTSIPLIIPYYDLERAGVCGKIVFYLDVEKLKALLEPALERGASLVYITNDRDELLFSYPTGAEADEQGDVVRDQATGPSGWKLNIVTPTHVIYAQLRSILSILAAGMALLLVIGVGLTTFVMNLYRRPLSHIVRQLPMKEVTIRPTDNSLWHINTAVMKLSRDREHLAQRLEEQRAELKNASLNRLISGNVSDEMEIESLLKHSDLDLAGDAYRGIYLRIATATEQDEASVEQSNFIRSVVMEMLPQFEKVLTYLMLYDRHTIILLYSQYEGHPENERLTETLAVFYQMLKNTYGVESVFYIGSAGAELNKLSRSFAEARSLMESGEGGGGQYYLVIGDKKPEPSAHYFYSASDEQSLISLVNKGDFARVQQTLDQIYEKNFAEAHLSEFLQRLLYARMIDTLASSEYFRNDQQALETALANLRDRAFFDEISRQYAACCEDANRRILLSQNRLIKDTVNYIEANYQDSAIGLTQAALSLGVTESHLSAFFKAKTGKTFSSCLENKRISKSCDLLSENALNVEEIALKVGYTNVNSFRRAYRRVMGYTPSQYREKKARDIEAESSAGGEEETDET